MILMILIRITSDANNNNNNPCLDISEQELARNLRSGFRFKFGLGNMRSIIRQVSDSFTNMF